MKKLALLFTILMPTLLTAQNKLNPAYLEYISQYKQSAIKQRDEHKIPASITLAQGLLESAAGRSELAKNANNHFGVKCTSEWQGETYHYDDDRKHECFRKYKHAEESYEDHSKFLLRDRYKELFQLKITDYKAWARGLKRCGYATDPNYAEKLIRIIEEYNLAQYDTQKAEPDTGKNTKADSNIKGKTKGKHTDKTNKSKDKSKEVEVVKEAEKVAKSKQDLPKENKVELPYIDATDEHQVSRINGKRCIIAREGDTFASIAREFNMSENKIRQYNDVVNPRYQLQEGDKVYLQPKNKYAEKKYAIYRVKRDENIWQIAQNMGMKLSSIYELNGIEEGQNVTINQELRLRK